MDFILHMRRFANVMKIAVCYDSRKDRVVLQALLETCGYGRAGDGWKYWSGGRKYG